MSNPLPQLFMAALDTVGAPISGSKLNFYEAGTTTRLDTYSDEPLTTAHANPVVADSAGRFAPIWLAASDYKVVWTDADDVTITTFPTVHGTIDVTGDAYAPSQQGTPDMTILLAAGSLFNTISKALVTNAAQTSAVITSPSSNPRIDIIYIDRLTGVDGVTTGSEAADPSDPTIPDDKLPVARVTLATTTTEITDSLIDDIRHLGLLGSSGFPPAFSAHRNGVTQTAIVGGVATKIKWTTEKFDTTGDFSADADDSGGATESRHTPSYPGLYLYIVQVRMRVGEDPDTLIAEIHKNGSEETSMINRFPSTGNLSAISIGIIEMNGTTDYVEAFIKHGTSANKILDGTATDSYFMGHYISGV